LEAAQDLLNIPDAAKGTQELGNSGSIGWRHCPNSKAIRTENQAGQSLGHNDLKSFLTTGKAGHRGA
jgi:hypothetical protein